MTETLAVEDYIALVSYFVLVLAVGIWSSFRRGKSSTDGYFLAGKHMTWLPVGASLFASNVGAPMFIGLAGAGAASGYSVVVYEWFAIFNLLALGWFFVPVYVSSGVFTIPEYVKKRFGGRRLQISLSVLSLLLYIITKISVEIYCGALFMQLLLGWNLYLCIISILAVTALYTVIGGLVAVMYTDTLQTVILLIGACVLTIKGFVEIGSLENLSEGFMSAVSTINVTNTTNTNSSNTCGQPPERSMHIWRDPISGDIPWPGALFGLQLLNIWCWCTDQLMVQRTLAAKNMIHAKGGSLMAGALKIFPFFLWIIPGMISRVLYPDEIACATPEKCFEVCNNEAGCSNIAYPLLVLRLLPEGVKGLMLAALLAALMSSLTSIFNSASSMFTMDVWPYFRKHASNNELMVVGRIAVLVCTGIGILWLPVLQYAQGGQLWGYLQAITAYTAPPWSVLFLLAILWKGTTEQGAFWGLLSGLGIGFIRLCLDFVYAAPFCGSGLEDTRPPVLKDVHFLYFAMILACITALIMVLISLCTQPRSEEQIGRTTWWTRHGKMTLKTGLDSMEKRGIVETDLEDKHAMLGVDTYDSDVPEEKQKQEIVFDTNGGKTNTPVSVIVVDGGERKGNSVSRRLLKWVCGMTDPKEQAVDLTQEEKAAIMEKFCSIKENPIASKLLNAGAILLMAVTCFLFGIFS